MNKKRIWGIVGFVAIVVVIFAFVLHQNDKKYIESVKQGSPNYYPNITYEKAFNNYFGNCEWSYFVSEDDEDIVEFNGNCTYRNKDVKIKIQFIVDYKNKTFWPNAIAINGTEQSPEDIFTIIEMVFEAY